MTINDPYPDPPSWQSMSMGEGRHETCGWPGDCPNSPDPQKRHNCVAVSCVQSVEHFVCQTCGWEIWD